MSRRFYLPQNKNVPQPQQIHAIWRRLRLVLTVTGVAGVAQVLLWYFTDVERWDAASHQSRYLGSSIADSNQPSRSSATTGISGTTKRSTPSDTQNAVSEPLLSTPVQSVNDHPVRLEIQNGCHQKGLAVRVAAALRARSTFFDVRGMTNGGRDTVKVSSVISRTADSSLAMAVADSLGIDRSLVKTEVPRNPRDVDVTVVLGLDYTRLHLHFKSDTKE